MKITRSQIVRSNKTRVFMSRKILNMIYDGNNVADNSQSEFG